MTRPGDHVLEAFMETLKSYLRSRGRMIISLAKAAGQGKVKIAASALYRYYEPISGYMRLSEVLDRIKSDETLARSLGELGITLTSHAGEDYIEVDVKRLEELIPR